LTGSSRLGGLSHDEEEERRTVEEMLRQSARNRFKMLPDQKAKWAKLKEAREAALNDKLQEKIEQALTPSKSKKKVSYYL